jgi:hypothetical protein
MRPTIWASHAMIVKLLRANKEAKVDHLLKEKKRLKDESIKLKQELAKKLKEKKRLKDEFVLCLRHIR